jgi:hypothetical protein
LVSRSNIYFFRQETNTRYLYLEGELAVLKVNFPSISVTAPQHPYDCNISPYYGSLLLSVTKPVTEFCAKPMQQKRKIKKVSALSFG